MFNILLKRLVILAVIITLISLTYHSFTIQKDSRNKTIELSSMKKENRQLKDELSHIQELQGIINNNTSKSKETLIEEGSLEKEIESFVLNYYLLIKKEKFDKAAELVFAKEENNWLTDELPNIWEPYEVVDINLLKLEEVTKGLYSAVVECEMYIKVLDIEETYFTKVHPFIAKIDGEWKVIINKRDIPSSFNVPFDTTDEDLVFPIQ